MRRRTFRRQPPPAGSTHIRWYNLAGVQPGEVCIFRHFHLNGDTANLIQRLTANHRARSAKRKWRPTYRYRLHRSVKQRAFVRRFTKTRRVALKRVRGEEMMRRLHHRQLFSFRNQPIVICRNERVGFYGRNRRSPQTRLSRVLARVDVAGFGVFMRGAGNVLTRQHVGQADENDSRPPMSRIRYSACPSASQCQAKRKW